MSIKKDFKTLDEQIKILKDKGLIINNIEKTKEILYKENYFFINGYRYIFYVSPKEKRFIKGTTFEELYAMFIFDRFVRNIMFKNILIIENNLKSMFSYQLSKKYGFKEKNYLNPTNFTTDYARRKQVIDVINKIKRQIRVNGKQHSATLHYVVNYGYVPLWILVKVLSFGIIGELFSILKEEDKLEIAKFYDIDNENLQIYIYILANYRNLCAHEDIVFDHQIQRTIMDTKYHRLLNIPLMNNEYIYGKNDLFAVIIVLKHLLSDQEFRLLCYEIDYEISILEGKVNSISLEKIMNRIGFPKNWRDIISMQ